MDDAIAVGCIIFSLSAQNVKGFGTSRRGDVKEAFLRLASDRSAWLVLGLAWFRFALPRLALPRLAQLRLAWLGSIVSASFGFGLRLAPFRSAPICLVVVLFS